MKGNFNLRNLRYGVLSPMVVATLTAMVLFFVQFRIPGPLLDAMNYIADMNTPLAMMVAGFSVAHSDLRRVCTNLKIYRVAVLKLLVIPLAVLLVLSFLPLDPTVAYTTLIATACPTATTITMMSILFNKNSAYASEIFSFTTVLSFLQYLWSYLRRSYYCNMAYKYSRRGGAPPVVYLIWHYRHRSTPSLPYIPSQKMQSRT